MDYSSIYKRATVAEEDPEERVRRPMNAFMVWASVRRREIAATSPTMHNSEISRILGSEWKAFTEEQKAPFREEARRIGELHKEEHPGYKYCPRRKKRRADPPMDSTPSGYMRTPSMAPAPGRAAFMERAGERHQEAASSSENTRTAGFPTSSRPKVAAADSNNRARTVTEGLTAIIGNSLETFRNNIQPGGVALYELDSRPVTITFAKYNFTVRLEPEKIAASLLPLFSGVE